MRRIPGWLLFGLLAHSRSQRGRTLVFSLQLWYVGCPQTALLLRHPLFGGEGKDTSELHTALHTKVVVVERERERERGMYIAAVGCRRSCTQARSKGIPWGLWWKEFCGFQEGSSFHDHGGVDLVCVWVSGFCFVAKTNSCSTAHTFLRCGRWWWWRRTPFFYIFI